MSRVFHFLLLLGVLLIFGMAVQCVPPAKVVNNTHKACEQFRSENYHLPHAGRILDNYTDATMMLVANGVKDESGWQTFFNNPLYTVYKQQPDWIDIFPLESICRDDLEHYKIYYPRYWHGYQIFLRPLLYFTDYKHIRQINLYLQVWLFGLILWLMWQNKAKGLMLGWILSYLIFNPEAMPLNMTYSILYYVSSVFMILMLSCREWIKEHIGYPTFFAMIGICTCFFDFLTYPIVPLATALTLLFYFEPEYRFKPMFKRLVILTLCFGGAYIGMWALKWILATLFTEQNVLLDAYDAIIHRAKSQYDYILNGEEIVKKFTRGYSIYITFWELCRPNDTLNAIIITLILAILPLIWQAKKCRAWAKENYVALLAFIGIACSTPLYCFLVSGHPLQHAAYTYRLWVATFFPLISMLNFWYIQAKEADNAQTQG